MTPLRTLAALLLALPPCCGCSGSPVRDDRAPAVDGAALTEAAAAPAAAERLRRMNSRRSELLDEVGGLDEAVPQLYRRDDQDGPSAAARAVEAYADEQSLESVLYAQAALGADPGNPARQRLLKVLEAKTGLPGDPDGILPLTALIQHERQKADQAFFDQRFGAALQACRKVLLLTPEDSRAWVRLGSIQFALGDLPRAEAAYRKARALDPKDAEVVVFMNEHGWQ
ncbi:MAG TPA: hypothetical protein DD417_18325 [Elusimicrobia bacterium]|nr:hypothetical protein [Elusimicrobiota bacterium]